MDTPKTGTQYAVAAGKGLFAAAKAAAIALIAIDCKRVMHTIDVETGSLITKVIEKTDAVKAKTADEIVKFKITNIELAIAKYSLHSGKISKCNLESIKTRFNLTDEFLSDLLEHMGVKLIED